VIYALRHSKDAIKWRVWVGSEVRNTYRLCQRTWWEDHRLTALAYIYIKIYLKEIRFETWNVIILSSMKFDCRICEHEYQNGILYKRLKLSCIGEGLLVVILQSCRPVFLKDVSSVGPQSFRIRFSMTWTSFLALLYKTYFNERSPFRSKNNTAYQILTVFVIIYVRTAFWLNRIYHGNNNQGVVTGTLFCCPLNCVCALNVVAYTTFYWGYVLLLGVKGQRNNLHEISKRKANWIGHIFRRNCLLR
jgi:hypothetical protein